MPRRRTRLLVREAVAALHRPTGPGTFSGVDDAGLPPVVVDLCCGSGAVGVAVAAAVAAGGSAIELHGADVDTAAVACAAKNVLPVGGQVHAGDLFEALPPSIMGRIRILAVNAPYVPTGAISTMPPEVRDYESHVALDGGADGLDFHRRVAAAAASWLEPSGCLLIETSERQAAGTAAIVAGAGFTVETVRSEELDGAVATGRWLEGNNSTCVEKYS